MKTDIEIKDYLYALIKGSILENTVNGGLYKDMRPSDSKNEDIIISVLDSLNGDIQNIIANVNIYVPDISRGNDKIENSARLRVLARLAVDLLDDYNGSTFRIEVQKQPILAVPDLEEHCINTRILISQTTF